MECLDDDTVASYLDGAEGERVSAHLAACSACRRLVSALASSAQPSEHEVGAANTLGRFEIQRVLGEGAAGQVYEAFDSELGRSVALKVLHESKERLLGEAQALARLQHPNVVAIHEVGVDGDTVFLVMDRVEGGSLSSWLGESERAWRDVCAVLAAAGQGLAAAHEAGVIHRDVKPDNILVAATGRVFIADFGLAARNEAPGVGARDLDDLALTATNVVVGTPLYMAPELLAGAPASECSDQYAFCVAAWEALCGRRPFAATTLAELIERQREPIARAPLPRRLGRVLRRGLDPDPLRRFPSMVALVEALEAAARPRRRFAVAGAAAVVVAAGTLGASVFGMGHSGDGARVSRVAVAHCDETGGNIEASFTQEHRAAVERAFSAVELPYATAAAERVTARLDDYATSWRQARVASCRATASGTQSEALGEARAVCFERLRWELEALVDQLIDADAAVVPRATTALAATSPDRACSAERVAVRGPDAAKRDVELGRKLAAVQAKKHLGRYQEALEAARAGAAASAATLDHRSTAAFELEECETAMFVGELEEAEAACAAAALRAFAVDDFVIRGRALAYLVYIVGYHGRRFDDAAAWTKLARAAVERDESEPFLEALLDAHVGAVEFARGDMAAARAFFERSRRVSEAELGAAHPSTMTMVENVAMASARLGDRDRARAALAQLVELQVEAVGAGHPAVARARHNYGIELLEVGRYRDARVQLDQAVAVRTTSLGDQHASVASTLNSLGVVHLELGEHAEARVMLERALAIHRRAGQASDSSVASRLINLAELDRREGRLDDAERRASEAHALWRAELGDAHPNVGLALVVLGRIAVDRGGELGLARARLTAAVAVLDAAGADEVTLSSALVALATLLFELDPAAAAATIERAATMARRSAAPPELRAEALLVAARARREGDRTAARALAREARDLAAASEAGRAPELRARIESFLARW